MVSTILHSFHGKQKEEFPLLFNSIYRNYKTVEVIANSIGAYFAINALSNQQIEKAYFISPVVDMERLIADMMIWANVTEDELKEKKEIQTTFGETLSWDYLCYARENPIIWEIPTHILYVIMAFDFKKEYKEFYMPKNKPEIVNVPKANYIAVRGKGNPNEEGGAYQQAISVLYAVAYTLKMSYKTDYKIEGFFEYVVPPLECFWWQDDVESVDYTNKSAFSWISVIRLPDFISKADFDWAVETATKKKKLDCSSAEYLTIDEGLCVQIIHIGSFDNEPATVALMDTYLEQNGYVNDINKDRLHHEIYMSDARKVAPEKWKTVIRHPIKKA